MRAILPQERLQVLIDNSVDLIDILDGEVPVQTPHLLSLGLSTGDIVGCRGLDLFMRIDCYRVMIRTLRPQTVTDNRGATRHSATCS
jgi:hypothetical protein